MATRVDKTVVNQKGADILEQVKLMYNSLESVKTLVNNSKTYFDSEAGNDVRNKFNRSAEKFLEFRSFLETYGTFLQNYSGNVKAFEDAVKDATSQIPVLED